MWRFDVSDSLGASRVVKNGRDTVFWDVDTMESFDNHFGNVSKGIFVFWDESVAKTISPTSRHSNGIWWSPQGPK